jgi:hypothetical protein
MMNESAPTLSFSLLYPGKLNELEHPALNE